LRKKLWNVSRIKTCSNEEKSRRRYGVKSCIKGERREKGHLISLKRLVRKKASPSALN